MFYKKCEICGIKSGRDSGEKRVFMAQFPLDEDRCKQWVKITGKEDLAYVPIEKLHTLKYICGKHFNKKDFNRKKTRLKKTALPSEELKSDPLPDEMLKDFPCHIAQEHMHRKGGSSVLCLTEIHVSPEVSTSQLLDAVRSNSQGSHHTKIHVSPGPFTLFLNIPDGKTCSAQSPCSTRIDAIPGTSTSKVPAANKT